MGIILLSALYSVCVGTWIMYGIDLVMDNFSRSVYSKFLPINGGNFIFCPLI